MPTTDYAAAIDTGDLIMSYAPEDQWGVLPAVQFQKIRLDGEGFSSSKSRTRPNEIDPDGQASAALTTKQESPGSLNFSVSAGTHNALLASSIGGVFGAAVNMAVSTISAAASDDSFNDTGNGFVAAGIAVGQWIKVAGFTGSVLNNGFFQVQTVAAGKITVLPAILVDDAAGEAVTIKGSMCRNGIVFQSFYFQKQLAAALFLRYAGSWPTGGSADVGVGDYLKGTLAFLNKSEEKSIAEASTGALLAAPTGVVIDSVAGIQNILRNGTAIDAVIQKIGMKWNKEGARAQYGIGSSSAQGMGKGKLLVTGNLSSYFKDFSLYDEFIAETAGPLSFRALDNLGKGYIFTFCNATIMNPKIVAGGPNQDVMADLEIEGNPGSTVLYGGKTVQIDYFS